VEELGADLVRRFMCHIEERRKCSVATRNQRLAALRTLATFIGAHSPEHLSWCAQIRSIPFKKSEHSLIGYLEKDEIDALLAAPDRTSLLGWREWWSPAEKAVTCQAFDLALHRELDASYRCLCGAE
jgi:integrase/recombinase XerD